MKQTLFFLLGVLSLTFSVRGFAGDDIVALVQAEIKKAQQDLRADWVDTKRKLESLKSQKQRTLDMAKERVESEKAAIGYFNDAIRLMTARYVNDQGEHQPGLEISVKDQEFVNRLFSKYLNSQPLQGRTSAGDTTRWMNWGIERLKELIKVHSAPLETTNPELEILSLQIKETEAQLSRTIAKAQKLGVEAPQEEDRKPTSEDAKKK